MPAPVRHLFVYGTLLRGSSHPMARLLRARADYVGEGAFPGRLYDLGPYPAAVAATGGRSRVRGEVYRLALRDGLMDALDRYEGCAPGNGRPPQYVRRALRIELVDGGKIFAWTYLYNRNLTGYRVVKEGDYANHGGLFRARTDR